MSPRPRDALYACNAPRSNGQKGVLCDGWMMRGELFLICTKCERLAVPEETYNVRAQVASKHAET